MSSSACFKLGLTYTAISGCKTGCDAEAGCIAFTFKNVNGFTCYYYTGWSQADLITCGTAYNGMNWISTCSGGADCPLTDEFYYKSESPCTATPTAPPVTPVPVTPHADIGADPHPDSAAVQRRRGHRKRS